MLSNLILSQSEQISEHSLTVYHSLSDLQTLSFKCTPLYYRVGCNKSDMSRQELFVSLFTVEGQRLLGHLVKMCN
jgi:hypothetical protein